MYFEAACRAARTPATTSGAAAWRPSSQAATSRNTFSINFKTGFQAVTSPLPAAPLDRVQKKATTPDLCLNTTFQAALLRRPGCNRKGNSKR